MQVSSVKLFSLFGGGVLVVLGAHLLIHNLEIFWFVGAVAILVLGQTIARFEDLPNGSKRISRIEHWVNQKKQDFEPHRTLTEAQQMQAPKQANVHK